MDRNEVVTIRRELLLQILEDALQMHRELKEAGLRKGVSSLVLIQALYKPASEAEMEHAQSMVSGAIDHAYREVVGWDPSSGEVSDPAKWAEFQRKNYR